VTAAALGLLFWMLAAPAESPFLSVAATPTPAESPSRTFCAEWVRQSREGYERLTLFSDGMVVCKRSRDGKDEIVRKRLGLCGTLAAGRPGRPSPRPPVTPVAAGNFSAGPVDPRRADLCRP